MLNISGAGAKVTIVSTLSFPFGFTISEFAHDADPIDIEPTELVGYEMLIDGSLYSFQKANPVKITLNVIPGGKDDINLKQMLLSKNGQTSLIPLPDQTVMTIDYGVNGLTVFTNGSILTGPLSDSITASAQLKSNAYIFAFGSTTRLNSVQDVVSEVISTIEGLL